MVMKMKEWIKGLKNGMPIALGYFPVAFSFGVLCVSSHMPLGMATFISLSNLTSSGQFAGVNLILSHASYLEISMTLLLINARYFLMSLSLSQKIDDKMKTWQRLIVSFGITDETFALASIEEDPLTFPYMLGFIMTPIAGWTLGTLAGECIIGLLPQSVQGAMGIALYGMFLAIIVPASKKSKEVAVIVLMAICAHCLLQYVPLFSFISTGGKLIIATLIATLLGAKLFPREEESYE